MQEKQLEAEGGRGFNKNSLLLAAVNWRIHNKTADRIREEKEKKKENQNAAVPS